MNEDEMRRRLKQEIDRMDNSTLSNVSKSRNSFWSWLSSTVKRIWGNVVDHVVEKVFNWLWDRVFA